MEYSENLAWLEGQQEYMIEQLLKWSRINSGSLNLNGLEQMHRELQQLFQSLEPDDIETLDLQAAEEVADDGQLAQFPLGKALRLSKGQQAPLQVFLCGHMDTVYGIDHPFQEPVYLDSHTVNGPGVADMKGGLLIMYYALQTLERSPWAKNIGWQVLLTPDEEIGSPGSMPYITQAASAHHVGLIFEPAATPEGELVGARKGSANFTIIARGRKAHAGRAFAEGRNAAYALAEYLTHLNQLNGQREGLTISVGRILSGDAINIVPDLAIAWLDIRIHALSDQAWLEAEFKKLNDEFNSREGFSIELQGLFRRPPKTMSTTAQQLFDLVADCGKSLALDIHWHPGGGVCDGNNLAAAGLATVDTLGVRGGHIHSEREFILLDSLVERSKLSALLLLRLAKEPNWQTVFGKHHHDAHTSC